MENLVRVIDIMFVIFILGAIIKVFRILELWKKYGIENMEIALSDSIEGQKDNRIKVYDSAETLFTMCLNLTVIFAWIYVHFWM